MHFRHLFSRRAVDFLGVADGRGVHASQGAHCGRDYSGSDMASCYFESNVTA